MQTAEMLKPQTQAPDGTDNTDFSPQVVSIINRATRDLYQPSNYQACELVISALMKYSKLNLKVFLPFSTFLLYLLVYM